MSKKIFILPICFFIFVFIYFVFSNASYSFNYILNSSSLHVLEEINPEDAPSLLIGEWIIAPINDLKPGSLIIKDENNYSMTRWDEADQGSTITGEYKFDVSNEIYAVDFCLGGCDQPGSEWTTQVGILRFLSENEMEIQFSPDGKRLSEFTPKDNDPYFLYLTRKK
jgi:hypothetical protein